MSGRVELLRLLADGALHSGEELAAALSISRAAVWKRLQQLEAWGIALEARPGSGYQLESPIDLLDAAAIRGRLPTDVAANLRDLEVHEALDSTSDRLLAARALPPGRFDACLAEFQNAGRGRRGRRWVAPFASGLCLSVSWSYRDAPATLGALSLAAGVAALRALQRVGIGGLSLKWPNDIVRADAKLGGILIDLRGEAAGPACVVVGIGINVRLPRAARAALAPRASKPWTLRRSAPPGAQRARRGAGRRALPGARRVRRPRHGCLLRTSGRPPMRSPGGPCACSMAGSSSRDLRAAWTRTARFCSRRMASGGGSSRGK